MTPIWVFDFSPEETKAGRPVHAVLPKVLIDVLNEFITVYRPILVTAAGTDYGTLLLNKSGRPMGEQQFEEAVEEATLHYVKRSVNPHLFRDIYALEYLRTNDANYAKLSKILWHKTVSITELTYSWMFNESDGTGEAGRWGEERETDRASKYDIPSHCSMSREALARSSVLRNPASSQSRDGRFRPGRRRIPNVRAGIAKK
jgi:hypothetical protein